MSETKIDDILGSLSPIMRETLLHAYRYGSGHRWRIPPYCNANTVHALQRRGLADGWFLTDRGIAARRAVAVSE